MTVLQICANAVNVISEQTPNDITDIWHNTLEQIESEYLPNGSGFDSGSHLDVKRSTVAQLCFTTSFHAMQCGMYCGWLYYDIIVTPSLQVSFDLQVNLTGNESDCDEAEIDMLTNYIGETFYAILCETVAPFNP